MPSWASRSDTFSVVRLSSHASSGCRWRSRRNAISSSESDATAVLMAREGSAGTDRGRSVGWTSLPRLVPRPARARGSASNAASSRSAAAVAGRRPDLTSSWIPSRTARTPGDVRRRCSSSSRTSDQVKSSCCRDRLSRNPASPRAERWACTFSQTSGTPSPVRPEHVSTGGTQPWPPRWTKWSAPASSLAAPRVSASRSSALLTAMTSAISRIPFLMPWSWSPVRARVRNRKVSTMPATVTSDWPTPTVSTRTRSNPAASSTTIAWAVALATPPRCPRRGGPHERPRVGGQRRHPRLVPQHRPPVRTDEGSTARTPIRSPWPAGGCPGTR